MSEEKPAYKDSGLTPPKLPAAGDKVAAAILATCPKCKGVKR